MSNHLAIATVTAALREVLDRAVKGQIAGSNVTVTHVRPGTDTSTTSSAGVNIFLYAVAPNPAWRNDDLPTRRSGGGMVQRPRAALNLSYLISFYGNEQDLQPQRLMGCVVRALHACPLLPRQIIGQLVDAKPNDPDYWLGSSDLAAAPETVRFTPMALNLEELSRLWSVLFQTPYALSLAYQATMVTIDADETSEPALPVRARNLYAVPFRRPEIDEVLGEDGAPIVPGGVLVIRGRDLSGEGTRARLGSGADVAPSYVSAHELRVPLTGAADLRAGVQGVQVIHDRMLGTPPEAHAGEASNVAPFVLRPEIDPAAITYHAGSTTPTKVSPSVTLTLAPPVGAGQRVELLLNAPKGGPSYRCPRRPPTTNAATTSVKFEVPKLPVNSSWLVRVQVDGAESLLTTDASGLFDGPTLEVQP